MSRRTLSDYLDYFELHRSEVAYVQRRGYRTERWSYGRVLETASRFARELERREIDRGDHVLLWGENCAEWVSAFLGSVLRGAVAVPMDRVAAPEFARRVSDQVNARLCVCSHVLADQTGKVPPLALEELPGLVAGHAGDRYRTSPPEDHDPVQIVFTSGTTAEPKGVVITHRNVVANLSPFESEIAKYLKYERFVHPLRFLNLLPLSHVFGQFLGIYIPPLLGATVIFQETLNPTEIISTIRQERVSVLVAVPRMLEALRDKIERDLEGSGDLAGFRRRFDEAKGVHFARRWWRFRKIHDRFGWKFWAFVSGGAALDRETEEFWGRLSFVVIQGYGLTETTSLISVNHPFRLGKGSIGRVLPGREVRLDESGEILVRGEGIAAGYYQGREMKPVAGQEGWFHTGDVGELDSDGNLYFKGRKKSVIVTSAGMKVYPEDLESALREQPGVRDCVVVGVARDGNAEPCAVLILQGEGRDAEPIVRRANESLADYQRMRIWFVWPDEDFPRTSTQKPRTSVIQDLVQTRLAGAPHGETPVGSLAELIARVTGRAVGKTSADAGLASDLDLTSIDRVELLGAIEDRYQIDLNETQFSSARTLGELERLLREPGLRRSEYRYPRWPLSMPVRLIRVAVYYLVTWPATMLMAPPAVRGRENLKDTDGPILVVANHITPVDIGFIMAALPGRVRHRLAVAMWGELLESMRNPPRELRWFSRLSERVSYALLLALFNVFPLPQQSGYRESFAFAGATADRGYSIVVFPEGRRTDDGELSPFRAGVGLLANNLGLPVVPVRIDGLYGLKQTNTRWAPRGAVRVTVGPPVRFGRGRDPAEIAQTLEDLVRQMKW